MRKATFTILLLAWAGYARGEDCNRNGVEDAVEIVEGRGDDCNGNGIPDECDVRPRHIRFRLTERRPSDEELFDLRVADIDGDGDRDLVISDGISGRLHIAFNGGDGTFERDTIPIEEPGALSLADFDGDGLIDIALTEDSFPGSVRFLWNVGEGRFGALQKVPFDKDPFSLAPADFDMDGDLDLAVGSPASDRISLLENGGGREFEEVREYVARLSLELVAADLDTDGDLDLIGGGGGVPMTLLFNDGHGAFPKSRPYGAWSALEANDLDGDGDVDISGISPGPRGTLHLARNDGTGDFSDLTSLSIPGAQEHIAGDIDRDGDIDILVTEGGSTLVVHSWINDGKGAFAVVSSEIPTPSRVRTLDLADLDGDTWPDLVVVDLESGGSILILTQDALSPADCDGDGFPDECTGNGGDCDADGLGDLCEIRLGFGIDCNGNGVPDRCDLESGRSPDCNDNGIPDECDIASGESIDLTENGIPDECESDCNENGVFDFGEVQGGLAADCNGNGLPDECDILWNLSFSEGVEVPGLGFRGFRSVRRPLHADLDNDGDEDIVLPLSFSFTLGISWRLGGGRFEEEHLPLNFDPILVAAADLDSDGDLDLVTGNRSDAPDLPGNVSFLTNDGAGGFLPGKNFAVEYSPRGVVAADVDGDRDADVAVLHGFSRARIMILENTGPETFTRWDSIDLSRPSFSLRAVDLDGDGQDELLAAAVEDAEFVVLRRQNAMTFVETRHELPGEPSALETADLDNDGDTDLAIRSPERVFVFRNEAGNLDLLASYIGGARGFGLSEFALGDPDGDGSIDIIITRPQNSIFVLENLGTASFVPRNIEIGTDLPDVVSVTDIDEDGKDDLLLIHQSRTEVSFSSRGTSTDCDGNLVPDECDEDCDEDGRADGCEIAWGAPECNGNGIPDACDVVARLSFPRSVELELARPLGSLFLVDLDRDGRLDLFTASGGERFLLTVFRNLGAFRFEPFEPIWAQGNLETYTFADVDLDGDDDIVLGSSQVHIFKNDGSRFRYSQVVSLGMPQDRGSVISLGSGDLDRDGDLDLVALAPRRFLDGVNENGPDAVLLLRNHGNGTFVADGHIFVGCCVEAQAVLDADSDGDLDVLVGRRSTCADDCRGRWMLLRNRGDATFESLASEGATIKEFSQTAGLTADPEEIPGMLVSGLPVQRQADIDGNGFVDRIQSRPARVLFVRRPGASVARSIPTLSRGVAQFALGDLDGDGDPDLAATEVGTSARSLLLLRNDTLPAPSRDGNLDGIPDECDPRIPFHRGDPDGDGRITLTDEIVILHSLFLGEEPSRCRESEDFTNDGRVDLTDAVALLRFLFYGGAPPAFPGPPGGPCERDADWPGSARDLGCEVYEGC